MNYHERTRTVSQTDNALNSCAGVDYERRDGASRKRSSFCLMIFLHEVNYDVIIQRLSLSVEKQS